MAGSEKAIVSVMIILEYSVEIAALIPLINNRPFGMLCSFVPGFRQTVVNSPGGVVVFSVIVIAVL